MNRAPVQSDMDRRSKIIHPSGTIDWHEHLEVHEAYAERYGRSQSPERIAERGGFGRMEAEALLGRPLRTWEALGSAPDALVERLRAAVPGMKWRRTDRGCVGANAQGGMGARVEVIERASQYGDGMWYDVRLWMSWSRDPVEREARSADDVVRVVMGTIRDRIQTLESEAVAMRRMITREAAHG